MYSTSQEFDDLLTNQEAIYYITITKTSTGQVVDMNIDNFEYTGSKCVDQNFTFGNALCQSVKFSVHTPNVLLQNEEIFIEQGLYVDGVLENVPIGYFIVQKPVSDGEVTTYTCYDRMVKLDDLYMNEQKYANVFDVLYDISQITGIVINKPDHTKNYFIDTGNMSEWDNLYTMREVVGYLGGLYGKDALVDRNGEIVYKAYDDINYTINGNVIYQGGTTIESEYNMVVEKIVCRKVLPGYADEEYTVGSGLKTVYVENPFMNESILEETFERLEGLTYRGLSTKFLGDFRLDLGDIVTVVKDNTSYKCCIMEINHQCDGGLITKITSHAKTETEQNYRYNGTMSRTVNRDSTAIAEIKGVVNTHTQEIQELFTSVSNGKTVIASAITDKGVETSSTDTFATMATNILNIPSGEKKMPVVHGYAIDYIVGGGTAYVNQ